jgi:purine catabolism regulator
MDAATAARFARPGRRGVTVPLGQVLELDVFRRAEATILAGEDRLDHPVRWVHMGEIPDIARFLRGGELLLTAGTGIGSAVAAQRRYVRALAGVGASALILEAAGRAFSDVPDAIVHAAERSGLPLVALRREIPFIEVTEQVHALLINRQVEALQRAEAIGRELTVALGATERLRAIALRLADISGAVVVVEDAAHQVVEYAMPRGAETDLLQRWSRHSRAGHPISDGEAFLSDDETRCAWSPIVFADHVWGRLHIVELDRPVDEVDRLAAERAAAAVAMALLAERDATRLADQARENVISHLLHRPGSSATLLERARDLGADFTESRLLAVAARPAAPAAAPEDALPRLLLVLRRLLHRNEKTQLSAVDEDQVAALVGVRSAADAAGLVSQLDHAFNAVFPTVVGIAESPTPGAADRTLREACQAAEYGASTQADGVHRFRELALYQLLVHLKESGELARFVESELGPILDHDSRTARPLLPTVEAYVRNGGNKARTASDLFLQRRSLYYRLERIETLLGRSIEPMEAQVRLYLATRGLAILGLVPAAGVSAGAASSR